MKSLACLGCSPDSPGHRNCERSSPAEDTSNRLQEARCGVRGMGVVLLRWQPNISLVWGICVGWLHMNLSCSFPSQGFALLWSQPAHHHPAGLGRPSPREVAVHPWAGCFSSSARQQQTSSSFLLPPLPPSLRALQGSHSHLYLNLQVRFGLMGWSMLIFIARCEDLRQICKVWELL